MLSYILKIYNARYFWWSLVQGELRNKYRRSLMGMAWSILHPLILTILLVIVFGAIFKSSFLEFAPFVYAGLTLWEMIFSSFSVGTGCLLGCESYIRQQKHPMAIYSLKQSLVIVINYMIASIGVIAWCWFSKPSVIPVCIIALPLALPIILALSWSITTFSGFLNAKYRDFQQVVAIVLQAIWFVSPVYFQPKVFISAGLSGLVVYNPVTHILNLVREPLVNGVFPSGLDYLYSIGTVIFFAIVSAILIKKNEDEIIYYL